MLARMACSTLSPLKLLGYALAAALVPAAASAGGTPGPNALPGVDGGYRIVKPAPRPEPEDADAPTGGGFKVGDMDVHVSGSIIVDIGAGSIRPRGH